MTNHMEHDDLSETTDPSVVYARFSLLGQLNATDIPVVSSYVSKGPA
ncbi:hypothetical protein [Limimaricola cinnabarinus]|nr:hypothetical protein [Limimaricola cinnabarinus]